jgi:hypothetical protein
MLIKPPKVALQLWSPTNEIFKLKDSCGHTPEVARLSLKVGFPVSALQAKEQIGK